MHSNKSASKWRLGCVLYCLLNDKLFLKVKQNSQKANLPFFFLITNRWYHKSLGFLCLFHVLCSCIINYFEKLQSNLIVFNISLFKFSILLANLHIPNFTPEWFDCHYFFFDWAYKNCIEAKSILPKKNKCNSDIEHMKYELMAHFKNNIKHKREKKEMLFLKFCSQTCI